MNHDDRLKTLREIRRITKNGGYFCFSAHNLNYSGKLSTFKLSRKPIKLLREIHRLFIFRLYNRKVWKILRKNEIKQGHLVITEVGAESAIPKIQVYYITPEEQFDQLTNFHFKDIRTFNLLGKEITTLSELWNTPDSWLYYLCNV